MNNFFNYAVQKGDSAIVSPSDINKNFNILFDGDSLTWEQDGGHNYANRVMDTLIGIGVASVNIHTFGVSGQTLQTMLYNQVQTYSKIDALKENVIVAYNSVNSILNAGITAIQQYNDMVTYITNAKNNGFKKAIVITGYHPRLKDEAYNNGLWADRIDEQEKYFNLIKNTASPIWDVSVDLREESVLGGDKAQDYNPTYFKDSVHLYAIGDSLVGDFVISHGFNVIYNFN